MYRLTVTSALLVILPIAVGVMPPKMQSRRMVFWGACIIGFVFGLLFTSNAYHVKNAYMNLLASPNTIALIGIAWSAFLALPSAILLKILATLEGQEIAARTFSVLMVSFLGAVLCVAPSIPLIVMFSME